MKQLPIGLIVPLVFVDILSFALVFGATVWFFFIQSPQLIKFMGMLLYWIHLNAFCTALFTYNSSPIVLLLIM
jgi:hypothetical protein